jgi:hypothetical protein
VTGAFGFAEREREGSICEMPSNHVSLKKISHCFFLVYFLGRVGSLTASAIGRENRVSLQLSMGESAGGKKKTNQAVKLSSCD